MAIFNDLQNWGEIKNQFKFSEIYKELFPKHYAHRKGGHVLCAFHEDSDPSLKIYDEEDPPRGHCFGCGKSFNVYGLLKAAKGLNDVEVLQFLNEKLGKYDLKKKSKKKREEVSRRKIREYIYTDELGNPIYKVIREKVNFNDGSSKKEFKQEVWNKQTEVYESFKGCMEGVRRVWYKLKDIHENPKKDLFIVGGEKDVETLESSGFLATTIPQGESYDNFSKWDKEYHLINFLVKRRRITLIPDNDDIGHKYMKRLCERLVREKCNAKILELDVPEKGDVSDFIEQNGIHPFVKAYDQLWVGNKGIGFFCETATDLLNADIQEPEWIVEGILPIGLTMILGGPKIGKSYMIMDLCMAVSGGNGSKFMFRFPCNLEGAHSLYFALEDHRLRLQRRIKQIQEARNVLYQKDIRDNSRFHLTCQTGKLPKATRNNNATTVLDHIEHWHEGMVKGQGRLVVIDTLQKVRPGRTSGENAYTADVEDLGELQQLAVKLSIAIVIVHHTNKMVTEDFAMAASGSQGIAATIDTSWKLEKKRTENKAVFRTEGREVKQCNYDVEFDKDSGLWICNGELESTEHKSTKERVMAILPPDGATMRSYQIVSALGMDSERHSVYKALERLNEDGAVTKLDRGFWCRAIKSNNIRSYLK